MRRTKPIALLLACAIAGAGFIALGVWQLYRLHWKLDLIARVEARIHAPAAPPPAPTAWPHIDAAHDEYRRIALVGHFISGLDTKVLAVTELGSGYWIMTPFQLDDGTIVLVNRGFVPHDHRQPTEPPTLSTHVTGLLRLTEPRGGFLRDNDPAHARWYSRDVAAIAQARGLHAVAPYFIDAEASGGVDVDTAANWPRAGLTVTHFPNNHLGYALTWFALALLVAGAAFRVVWDERCARRLRSR